MAYLLPFTRPKCSYASWCGKYATCQLVDRWNGQRGFYCPKHGKIALANQNKNEIGNTGRT